MNRYIIGINTGGTYTDGVMLDYISRKVVSVAKSLTTREDLKVGVIKVLKKLKIEPDYNIKLVGISSTLATNTVAEGKAKKAGLLLIGYDKDLIGRYGLLNQIPASTIGYFKGGHTAQGMELSALDKQGVKEWVLENQHDVEAVAVSGYFSPLNPEHEEAAFKIIRENSSLPVVMAHQLSTKLDSIKRAATASINASLVVVMSDFIEAVNRSMKELGIKAPLMIVRGDGTLMPANDAVKRPVETVLSGPAASAIGGRFLSGNGNALVIDMGGTTTDMALINDYRVVVSDDGAKVGNYNTAVEAAKVRTISLGCDSRIYHNEKSELMLGPHRVRPLSQIAMYHENVVKDFNRLKKASVISKDPADIEYWYLHGSVDENEYRLLNDKQKKIIDLIRKPHRLSGLFKKVGVYHASHLQMDEFIDQGKIECSAITPSDLLHAERNLELWNREVAVVALEHYSGIYGKSPRNFTEEVFNKIINILVEEMIIYLACQNMLPSDMPASIDGEWGKWMLQQILDSDNNFLSIIADSRFPIVGTGAPARHFLKKAAKTIKAKFILPEFYDVANAVGAVSGSISEIREVIVFVRDNKEQYSYIAKHGNSTKIFREYNTCCDYAEETAYRLAKEAAIRSGAADCFVEVSRRTEASLLRFIARAIGNPRLSDLNYNTMVGLPEQDNLKPLINEQK